MKTGRIAADGSVSRRPAIAIILCLLSTSVLVTSVLAQSSSSAPQAPTTPCPLPATEASAPVPGSGLPISPPIPKVITVPATVSPPSGTAFYATSMYSRKGTPEKPGSQVVTDATLAPKGFTCAAVEAGDGVTYATLTNPQDVHEVLVGGYLPQPPGGTAAYVCPFFASARGEVQRTMGSYYKPADCQLSSSDTLTMLPTGSSSLLAAVVKVPAGVTAPSAARADAPQLRRASTLPTFALVTWNSAGNQGLGEAQSSMCTLPTVETKVCAASLQFFLTTSELGKHLTNAHLVAALADLWTTVTGHSSTAQLQGPTEPCVVTEASGYESLDLTGGAGVEKVGEAGITSGTGLTAVGQRLSDLSGTVSLVVDQSNGPLVGLGLDGAVVGGEPAAKAAGEVAPAAHLPPGASPPQVDLSADFSSSIGAGRLWDFPTIQKTMAFVDQVGGWYSSHSYVFLPGLSGLIKPDDQLPPPDETWLTQASSLQLGADASLGLLAASTSKEVPLTTLTDAHLRWRGPPSHRSLAAILLDYQIPTARTGREPLSPPISQISGTMELTIPAHAQITGGAPSEVTFSYDTVGNLTHAARSLGFSGLLGSTRRYVKPSVGRVGSSYTEDSSRIEMTLRLDANSEPALARFWAALETHSSDLPGAEQALYQLIQIHGSIMITSYRVEASSDAPFSIAGQYDVFTASADASDGNEYIVLTGAQYWNGQQQKFLPWSRCTQSRGAAPLHLSPGA